MSMLNRLFIIALLLKIYDFGTTYFVVSKYGESVEANPIIRSLIVNIGLINTMLLGMLIYSAVALWLYLLHRVKTLMLVVLLMLAVAVINTISVFSVIW